MGAVRYYGRRLVQRRQKQSNIRNEFATLERDSRFAVQSGEAAETYNVYSQRDNQKWGLCYAPSRENIFREALQNIPVNLNDYVFIDVGAGKGLVVSMACLYPFKKVIGIEYSESLAQIGLANIRSYTDPARCCFQVEYICADATAVELPNEPTIMYLYNPFQGRAMDQMIKNIQNSLRLRPRDLWIIYVNPWEHRKFRRSPELNVIQVNRQTLNWEFCIYRSHAQSRTDGPTTLICR